MSEAAFGNKRDADPGFAEPVIGRRFAPDFVSGGLVPAPGVANPTISQIKNLRQGIAGGFGGIKH
jgi:hypothetical protein